MAYFFPSLPSMNVKRYPKREAFDKAIQAQPHHFCYVSALGWVCTARTQEQTHWTEAWTWPLETQTGSLDPLCCGPQLALWVGC